MPETVKFTPFGTPIRKSAPVHLSGRMVPQYGLELDKETGSTKVVAKDSVDFYALIQSYRSQCGMELAKLQISRGLASPNDFAAAPGDYGDITGIPDNLNDAYRASLNAKSAAKASGIDLNQFKTSADIQAYVDRVVSEKLKAAEKAKAAAVPAADTNGEVK